MDCCQSHATTSAKTSVVSRSQLHHHVNRSLQSSGNLATDRSHVTKQHPEEGRLRHLIRALVDFLIKFLSFFRILSYRHERLDAIHPTDSCSQAAVESVEEDRVAPCVERLKRLEAMFSELSSKPAVIPLEKEQALQESWYRIKSIEFDLEKTKKVLHATVVQQMEIAETLETAQVSEAWKRTFC